MKIQNVRLPLSRRFLLAAAGAFAATTIISSCAPSQEVSESAGSETPAAEQAEGGTLTIGVSPVPHAEILQYVKDNLAEEAGLEIEIVEFSDYVQPNLALNDEQIDANYFQHVPYMEDFGSERGIEMVAVAPVHIEPLGIYSNEIESLEQVPDGATIAIPNDATNLGRSLKLLEDQGLLILREGAGVEATIQDIEENPKNLEFAELEAAQLPRALEDVELAIINGNYALQANLSPGEDALALETAEDNPYSNVLTVLPDREQDPNVQKLAELLTSEEVKQFIEEKYQGSVIPAL
ncbi:MetQ/NlpA family ABC transporter substrate-binding protein [Leptolyngbya sp. FACHB-671]|uniref:MetQ/NlpA family ABC transporter substrate-binding protein n=1 Tax=Leptolyngbya sp. FACHB-671 TaxID=2692812 RepID=UPI0016886D91|nr:MetQ/NlpA family ABC transporter substrate-binding protein [Leptolyngbya sp. FACHB-671]MBD2071966.1 MetQ/NlpA family ABC transporter substrate-binding protein [Leptolyngbya sp. FACHB-671]